jgi:hypothetical protein
MKVNWKLSKEMWNHYRNFGKQITNDLERWYRCSNRAVGKRHVNIFEFINALKLEQTKFEAQKGFLDTGESPPKIRRKYAKLNEKILLKNTRMDFTKVKTSQF